MPAHDDVVRMPPILCSIPKAGAAINRCERFIYEAIATGQIEAVKSDKRTLVVMASLQSCQAPRSNR
jgi:hypothetical protein